MHAAIKGIELGQRSEGWYGDAGVSQIDFRKSCMVAENKKRERWDWHGEWVERDCRSGGREVMVGSVSVGGDI